MEVNRSTFLFILLFITFVLLPDSQSGITTVYEEEQVRLFSEHFNSNYGVLNGTSPISSLSGFQLSYDEVDHGYNLTHLPEHPDNQGPIPRDVLDNVRHSVWNLGGKFHHRIPASLHGSVQIEQTHKPVPMPLYDYMTPETLESKPPTGALLGDAHDLWYMLDQPGDYNITFTDGDLDITVTTLFEGNGTSIVALSFTLADSDASQRYAFDTFGVYDASNGRIITTSRSAKFDGWFGMPFFSDAAYAPLIAEYLKNNSDAGIATVNQLYSDAGSCEMVGFLQVEPVKLSDDELDEIDEELRFPLGRPTARVPPVEVRRGVLYSPDCGYSMHVKAAGVRKEQEMSRLRQHLSFGILLLLGQTVVLFMQMSRTTTPSSISRLSYTSMSMMNIVDGSLAMMYLVASCVVVDLYLPLVVSAFIGFILASIFETRYMVSIYASQLNERAVSLRTLFNGEESPAIVPQVSPEDEASISSTMYTRFFFMMIFCTIMILSSVTWSKSTRSLIEKVAIFVLNSYWLPQVYRNVLKNSEESFSWMFILSTTVIRLVPVVYVYTYEDNVFRHHLDRPYVVFLVLWMLAQICLLKIQGVYGARCFMPGYVFPEGYNYHKVFTQEDLEEGLHLDCAVCMAKVDVCVEGVESQTSPESYMVTPCNHIFHTECLTGWMRYKLQCPVCRSGIPPL